MDQEHIFTIEYKLYGVPKKFIMRAARLNDETAWHWAACDAGATPIPKRGKLPLSCVPCLWLNATELLMFYGEDQALHGVKGACHHEYSYSIYRQCLLGRTNNS